MEKIIIKNFLIFDDVEMPIRRLNVLIGEQASGKSLLAKLVYFFQNFGRNFLDTVSQGKNYEEFEQKILDDFVSFFPTQFWQNKQEFSILYLINEINIRIVFTPTTPDNFGLKLLLDTDFSIFYAECLTYYYGYKYDFEREIHSNKLRLSLQSQSYLSIYEVVLQSRYKPILINNTFIPAGRSFFSLIENNAFSLLNNLNLEPVMQEFGITIQSLKNAFLINKFNRSTETFNYENYIDKIFQKILKGTYQKIDGNDWLIAKDMKVSLLRASSGQQEIFPIMLMLASLENSKNDNKIDSLFIEEPEAHLFPQAQNSVVSAILYIMNQTSTNFFITTHSPYILTALNNSIFAQELIKKDKLTLEKYVAMSDGAYPIDFDDISAYSLDNGKLINIKDQEYKMLGGEILDQVSNDFGNIFNMLLELDN